MCGRFARYSSQEALIEAVKAGLPDLDTSTFPLNCREGYNVAPTQMVLGVGKSKPDHPHKFSLLAWGFVPSWASDLSRPAPINAKGETVATSGMFRSAFNKRRCLILSDGFYEWRMSADPKVKGKTPFYFSMRDGKPFAFAGVYDVCKLQGTPIPTCAVITTTPNAVTAPVHDRMPLILSPDDYREWCDPEVPGDAVAKFIKPYPAELMQAREVSTLVNNTRNDMVEILEQTLATTKAHGYMVDN